jgi:GNAT superfamily N-acetyltransferase
VDLAKKNSEAVSFLPRPKVEAYAADGRLLVAAENGEPCGFLIHGPLRGQLRIYQTCVEYDVRRRDHGLALVGELERRAVLAGCSAVRLWCADDLEAQAFWRAAGFVPAGRRAGGQRRGRVHTLWARHLVTPPLLAVVGEPRP